MPYLMKTTNNKDDMTQPPPFGPGVAPDMAALVATMEVWGSSFDESCGDWCEFVLKDAFGVVVDRRRVSGY